MAADEAGLDGATDRTLLATRVLVGVAARSLSAIDGDVTLPQYRALVLLASRGDQNASALADALASMLRRPPDCATGSSRRD